MVKALGLLLLLSSTSLFAICGNTNLLTQPNSPFLNMPVLNQNNSGTCYAYTTAQMINFKTSKMNLGSIVHPLWVAIRHSEAKNKDSINVGAVSEAYDNFVKSGSYCPNEVVESALLAFSKKYRFPRDQIIEFINNRGWFDEKNITNGCDVAGLYKLFQDPAMKTISSPELFIKLLVPNCKMKKVPNIPQLKRYDSEGSYYTVEQNIYQGLRSENPIGLTYCSNIWDDQAFSRTKNPNRCKSHASLIVGQRIASPGGCQYLIRNSWGDKWGPQFQNKTCMCRNRKSGVFVDNCNSRSHNDKEWSVEGCWFNQRSVSQNTLSINTFK